MIKFRPVSIEFKLYSKMKMFGTIILRILIWLMNWEEHWYLMLKLRLKNQIRIQALSLIRFLIKNFKITTLKLDNMNHKHKIWPNQRIEASLERKLLFGDKDRAHLWSLFRWLQEKTFKQPSKAQLDDIYLFIKFI